MAAGNAAGGNEEAAAGVADTERGIKVAAGFDSFVEAMGPGAADKFKEVFANGGRKAGRKHTAKGAGKQKGAGGASGSAAGTKEATAAAKRLGIDAPTPGGGVKKDP